MTSSGETAPLDAAPLRVLSEALIVCDLDGRVVEINTAAGRLFGYALEEIQGRPVDLLAPERLRERHEGLRRTFLDGVSDDALISTRRLVGAMRKDGTEFSAEVSLARVSLPGGRYIVAAVREVVGRPAERGEATSGQQLAQELQIPLRGIQGVVGALTRTGLDEQQAEMVRLIERSAATLSALVSEALSARGPDGANAGGLRILLADDHPVSRRVVGLILEGVAALTTVDNGRAAVEAAAGGAFDLILMDIHMPGLDGLEAISRIRSEEVRRGRAPVHICAVSGDDSPERRRAAERAGADGFIFKPVGTATMLSLVAGVSARRTPAG